jgi:hypothetical protein
MRKCKSKVRRRVKEMAFNPIKKGIDRFFYWFNRAKKRICNKILFKKAIVVFSDLIYCCILVMLTLTVTAL